jgi:ParB family transcriptional regulator, chromosome partitioning protein
VAKTTGLGKGLGALLSENPTASAEVAFSTGAASSVSVNNNSKVPSCVEVDENGGLWVNPEYLKPNPHQPRQEFNQAALEELSASVKESGVLEPIVVEYIADKEFYIIAGERRTRAAKMAGLEKVPVVLRKYNEQQKLEMALIENIQRANLNPIEEASAYYNLVQMSDLTQEEVAKRVGKNRSTVANAIRLLKLPSDMKKALIEGIITPGHARAILMTKNDADMRILFGKIVGGALSVRQAEELADQLNNGGRAASTKKAKKTVKKDPDVALFEQNLRNIFGVKGVSMNGTMDKGSIVIEFSSKNDFDRICDVLKIEED